MSHGRLMLGLLCILPMMAWAAFCDRADVKAFVQEVAQQHALSADAIEVLLNQAKIEPQVLAAIQRPYEAKPWHQYQKLFVTDFHIREGLAFWHAHEATLARVEALYGVPPELVVAIIGIETKYGRNQGKFRVLDALATLGFEYPPRSAFFKQELAHFLVLLHEEGWSADEVRGSYAGAFGIPQFIPSSYRHYAVALEGPEKPDIVHNIDNAIASVGHYFYAHGWQKDSPIAHPTQLKEQRDLSAVLADPKKPQPKVLAQQWRHHGLDVPDHLAELPACILGFEQEDRPEYWLGFHNFYVITRYNHSHHYAMAAYQLSLKLRSAHESSHVG